MRETIPWSKDEEDFIRVNYTEYTDEELATKLGRTFRSIKSKRERLGLFRYFQEQVAPIKNEKWAEIGDSYEVSDKGRLRKDGTKFLRPHVHITGYVYICIKGKAKLLHRLVWEAFNEKISEDKEINHKDCNKLNNSLYNLELVTHSENMKHAYENGCFTNFFGR